jgi:hypothetical protein
VAHGRPGIKVETRDAQADSHAVAGASVDIVRKRESGEKNEGIRE